MTTDEINRRRSENEHITRQRAEITVVMPLFVLKDDVDQVVAASLDADVIERAIDVAEDDGQDTFTWKVEVYDSATGLLVVWPEGESVATVFIDEFPWSLPDSILRPPGEHAMLKSKLLASFRQSIGLIDHATKRFMDDAKKAGKPDLGNMIAVQSCLWSASNCRVIAYEFGWSDLTAVMDEELAKCNLPSAADTEWTNTTG